MLKTYHHATSKSAAISHHIRNKAMIYIEETKRLHMTLIRFILQPTHKIFGKFIYEGDKKTTRYYLYPVKTT